ncbi:glycosyltransferase family 2 protein [Rhodoblastus acidophilus]|uniref:Glycosyltransferase family 2 protein n=1 Tax=Candidatus Rhodoblastus alkanivorans TaxID=2954117 RepID=A0ABS9Z4Z6_9HYPH|nr:glycosyltransferase family 2 protein [Candidatus Rhodoblastus alkanivorans]MCI4680258.1 glycosyltransferase family 2 protein [Candidatus Rhodoblastus alkanivorans]MCI4682753.1 glycosyltransferase family 2 protein [Candidatus Rhodoblastus alkanivorans]MDI4640060.1 glycosyltransferase family 2 protein [Rhodoblastus acidophilus]
MSSTLCVIVKNEAPYLAEWALFHRMIGFDRIVAYENDSDDSTPEVLDRLKKAGIIDEHNPWRNVPDSPQFRAYVDATLKCATDWIMFLDADEFLNIKSRAPVNSFLAGFAPDISCVAVNWRIFGSSGHKTFEPGLVLERFSHAASARADVNRHVKCLFRPRCATNVHMHAPTIAVGRSALASGAPLAMATHGLSDELDWSAAQVNHYFDKSYEEYAAKRRRGIARVANADPLKFTKYTDEMFRAHDLNDEADHSLSWAIPELKARLAVFAKI